MKYKLIISFFIFVGLSTVNSFSQEDIIEINNTSIVVPDVYDFGDINEAVYSKYMIKNNRNSKVVVSDIATPAGFFASISDMTIASGKKVILYFGLDPAHSEIEGVFEKTIIIKTNLITDIEVKLVGNIVKVIKQE